MTSAPTLRDRQYGGRGALSAQSGLFTGLVNAQAELARQEIQIINHNDAVLKVKYGAGCSADDFHFSLGACTADDDGKGGSTPKEAIYKGIVSVYSAGTYRYAIVETV